MSDDVLAAAAAVLGTVALGVSVWAHAAWLRRRRAESRRRLADALVGAHVVPLGKTLIVRDDDYLDGGADDGGGFWIETPRRQPPCRAGWHWTEQVAPYRWRHHFLRPRLRLNRPPFCPVCGDRLGGPTYNPKCARCRAAAHELA